MHSHNEPSSHADVAELADAQVSEACDGDIVEVQVLSSAPSEPSPDYIDLLCNLGMVFFVEKFFVTYFRSLVFSY